MQSHDAKDESGKPYDKSIRKRLTRIVSIPSAVLLVLWTGASLYFFITGYYVRTVAASVREVSIPAATTLAAFQKERQIALRYVDNPSLGQTELQRQQQATDEKLAALKSAFAATITGASDEDEVAAKVNVLRSQFDQLPVLRSQIGFRSIDRDTVNNYYNGVLDAASDLFDTQARVVPDAAAAHGGITATAVFRAGDMMSREMSLVSTAFAAKSFAPDDFVQFTKLSGYYRTELAQISPFLDPEVRQKYEALTTSAAWTQLAKAEDALVKRGPWSSRELASVPVTDADWQNVANQVAQQLNDVAIAQADKVSAAAIDSGNAQLRNAILGSIAALLMALGAIFFARRMSRSLVDRTLVTRLARLRDHSLDVAGNRLPDIVDRLKNGEAVDIEKELPQLDHGRDEIGQVAEAFNIAQRTAVNAAASEAKARSGVHNVFLGIAHRNQVLAHQQLAIIDEMERREEDSTQLQALFKLDHLATRARRTTENLIILGGKQPGRRWRNPVPLMDILRAAVSETKQYQRVTVEQVADVEIVGAAVADIIHLIAELIDNATECSPPDSPVEVTSQRVARGLVIDVSDHGLGMKDKDREWANAMMQQPPEFDAMALRADSSLGLFVVARLKNKLGTGTGVHFDPSRYGGLRVTVLIPAQHLAGQYPTGHTDDADSVASGKTAVLAPVGTPASQAQERSTASADTPMPLTGQVQMSSDRKPRPYPAQVVSAPGSVNAESSAQPPPGQDDDRPRLPRRRPQQNLVAQLRDEPENEPAPLNPGPHKDTVRTLTAFHKGTLRGRHGAEDS